MTFRNTPKLVGALALALGSCLYGRSAASQVVTEAAAVAVAGRTVDFSREVRPILSQNCFTCHGPNERDRRGGLRLDLLEGFFGERPEFGGPAVVAGNADESLLYERLITEVERDRMPRGRAVLTDDEIETIRLWIEQGAEWTAHWAFVAPQRPALPAVASRDWVRNPIDNFVLARLEQEGLSPSPEPDRATLIRRVSLDLT